MNEVIGFDCDGNIINYDLDLNELHKTLENILKNNKKSKIEEINDEIKKQKELKNINSKQVSDTHHTFEKLYEQRVILFSILCNQFPELSWKSKKHYNEEIDPMFNGDFIAGINTPKGQATFHIKLKYWNLFNIQELDRAFEYDGYNVDDVIERLLSLNEYEVKQKKLLK